jgi:hypothetical protein
VGAADQREGDEIVSRWKLETIIGGQVVTSEISSLRLAHIVTRIGAARNYPHLITRVPTDGGSDLNLAQNLHRHAGATFIASHPPVLA